MTTNTTSNPIARKLNDKVHGVSAMKAGLSLDLGYENPAYLASSVHDGIVNVGDILVGMYQLDTRADGKFARITRLDEVIVGAGDSAKSVREDEPQTQFTRRKFDRKVESVSAMRTGFSLDLGHNGVPRQVYL